VPLTPSESELLEAALLPTREHLGDTAEAVWAEGLALSLPQAIDLAFDSKSS
jgi:hypothetical protein